MTCHLPIKAAASCHCGRGMLLTQHALIIAFFLSIALFIASCAKNKAQDAEREDLFDMRYGVADNELDISDAINSVGQIHAFHTMIDGFFYVTSPNKLVEMNSYGSVMYVCRGHTNDSMYSDSGIVATGNGSIRPIGRAREPAEPLTGRDNTAMPQTDMRRTFKYPLIDVNGVTVDHKRCVYVASSVPEDEKRVADNGIVLSYVVLRITQNAEQDDYIGRQGAGGAPFPYIRSVNTTSNDELVVVCQSMEDDGVEAWYYSRTGHPTGCVSVPPTISIGQAEESTHDADKSLGGKDDSHGVVRCQVRDVLPDRQSRTLLVCADSYDDEGYAHTFVIKIDVDSGDYKSSIEIPPYERVVTEDFGKVSYNMPYDFVGVADGGDMFFAVATDDGFAVQVVPSDGRHIVCRNLLAERKDTVYHSLAVSSSGIVSAMMAGADKASFMWWRFGNTAVAEQGRGSGL